jgi:integrase
MIGRMIGGGGVGKLTAGALRGLLKPEAKPGAYGDGGGLYLHVRGSESRSWLFRYKLHGRARLMGLGSAGDVSLAEARELANEGRKLVRHGTDPIEQRRSRRAQEAAKIGLNTFAEVAASYIAAHEASWRNAKHRQQWRNTLETYAVPVLGKLNVAAISTAEVTHVLEPIWREKPETASRVRGRIETVLDYATARGWRTGENPARWRGHLANILPARAKLARVEHHAALPWRDMGAFWETLTEQHGVAALALRFTILTAARTGEVIGARWAEIDMDNAIWTVPAERMKAGREHRVPLCEAALTVLREASKLGSQPGTFVFPGARSGKPLSNMAMAMLLARMGRDDVTVHGFRSTFRQWCAEHTNAPRELAEAALAHTLKDKVEAAYQRGDLMERRRLLMADWAAFCGRPAPNGEVLPMRRALA